MPTQDVHHVVLKRRVTKSHSKVGALLESDRGAGNFLDAVGRERKDGRRLRFQSRISVVGGDDQDRLLSPYELCQVGPQAINGCLSRLPILLASPRSVIRQYFRKRFMSSKGLITPACGVPQVLPFPPLTRGLPLSSRSSGPERRRAGVLIP
jgi:hypothetical protein